MVSTGLLVLIYSHWVVGIVLPSRAPTSLSINILDSLLFSISTFSNLLKQLHSFSRMTALSSTKAWEHMLGVTYLAALSRLDLGFGGNKNWLWFDISDYSDAISYKLGGLTILLSKSPISIIERKEDSDILAPREDVFPDKLLSSTGITLSAI